MTYCTCCGRYGHNCYCHICDEGSPNHCASCGEHIGSMSESRLIRKLEGKGCKDCLQKEKP